MFYNMYKILTHLCVTKSYIYFKCRYVLLLLLLLFFFLSTLYNEKSNSSSLHPYAEYVSNRYVCV